MARVDNPCAITANVREPMAPQRSVPSTLSMAFVRALVRAGRHHGLSTEELLTLAGGLSREALDAPRGRVSVQQFSRFYAALVRRLHNENPGMTSRVVAIGAFETVVRACVSASTFAECLEVMTVALSATAPPARARVVQRVDGIGLSITEPVPPEAEMHELFVFTTCSILAWLFGRRVPPERVEFMGAAPAHRRELESAYGSSLAFGRPNTTIWFSSSLASLPLVRTASEVRSFVRRAPASAVEALLSAGEHSLRVREALQRALPELLSLEGVAVQLAMSSRSLHRRLEAEGTSFQLIKDELRRDLAIYALARTRTPLKQIAVDVGFADQASFARAFVHWTGRSPGTWRKLSNND